MRFLIDFLMFGIFCSTCATYPFSCSRISPVSCTVCIGLSCITFGISCSASTSCSVCNTFPVSCSLTSPVSCAVRIGLSHVIAPLEVGIVTPGVLLRWREMVGSTRVGVKQVRGKEELCWLPQGWSWD